MRHWFARFKSHPASCTGHIVWGIIAGCLDEPMLFIGGLAYQFGSHWRKGDKKDTVGLDCFDYAVGYAIGKIIWILWTYFVK